MRKKIRSLFWAFVKSKAGSKSVPNPAMWNNNKASSPVEQAEMFNDYFQSVLPDSVDCNFDSSVPISGTASLCNISLLNEDVLNILGKLNNNEAPGPACLKELRYEIYESLCILFNNSIPTGDFPSD